jgi:hypothetical protein
MCSQASALMNKKSDVPHRQKTIKIFLIIF